MSAKLKARQEIEIARELALLRFGALDASVLTAKERDVMRQLASSGILVPLGKSR